MQSDARELANDRSLAGVTTSVQVLVLLHASCAVFLELPEFSFFLSGIIGTLLALCTGFVLVMLTLSPGPLEFSPRELRASLWPLALWSTCAGFLYLETESFSLATIYLLLSWAVTTFCIRTLFPWKE